MNKIFYPLMIMFAAFLWALEGILLLPKLFNLNNTAFIVFMIHFLGFIIMQPLFFNSYKTLKKFDKKDSIYLFLIAFFGGSIGTLSIVKALSLIHHQPLSIVILLQKLQPIFAIILALIILKEKVKKNFYLWASIAIAASYTLTFEFSIPNLETGKNTILAASFAILAAFSFASGTVFSRGLAKKYDNKSLTFFRYGLTSIIMILFIAIFQTGFPITNLTKTHWTIFILIPLTTGIFSMYIYYKALTKIKAMTSTICELFFPISAIMLDYFINGAILTPIQWISATIMIYAIIKITFKKK